MTRWTLAWISLALLGSTPALAAEKVIGEVVTARNFTGPDDTISVVRFDDPRVPGASCYLSTSQKGGFASNFGMQEERNEATLDCFASRALTLPADLPAKEAIRETSRSLVFKTMYVVRLVDKEANRLVYVAYTRNGVDGSPRHAMSSIQISP